MKKAELSDRGFVSADSRSFVPRKLFFPNPAVILLGPPPLILRPPVGRSISICDIQ